MKFEKRKNREMSLGGPRSQAGASQFGQEEHKVSRVETTGCAGH